MEEHEGNEPEENEEDEIKYEIVKFLAKEDTTDTDSLTRLESVYGHAIEPVKETSLIKRFKGHLSRNKKFYIGTGVGVLTTAIGSGLFLRTSRGQVAFSKISGVSWKPIINTHIHNYMDGIERQGHPGKVLRIIETGDKFPSQNEAAAHLGTSTNHIREHLKGARENVRGVHLEFLGDAMPPSQN